MRPKRKPIFRDDDFLPNDAEKRPEFELVEDSDEPPLNEIEMLHNYNVDMAEDSREGDEMSGDDHSSGLQGHETEVEHLEYLDGAMPGSETEREEEEFDKEERERADKIQ